MIGLVLETVQAHALEELLPNCRSGEKPHSPPESGGDALAQQGWGGLFKDEQYRLTKSAFASIHKVVTHLLTNLDVFGQLANAPRPRNS